MSIFDKHPRPWRADLDWIRDSEESLVCAMRRYDDNPLAAAIVAAVNAEPGLRVRIAELEDLFQQTHGVHVSWIEEGSKAAAYKARVAALDSCLRNLLARIHRDGGHRTDAVGIESAVTEADSAVALAYSGLDELRASATKWVDAVAEAESRADAASDMVEELRAVLVDALQLVVDACPHARSCMCEWCLLRERINMLLT